MGTEPQFLLAFVATLLGIDVLQRWMSGRTRELFCFRGLTLTVVLAAFVLLLFNLGSAIMDWSFLSMGLRGATLCFPVLFAVFLQQYDLRRSGALSIIVAPTCVILSGAIPFDLLPPLYVGLGVSVGIFAIGIGCTRFRNPKIES